MGAVPKLGVASIVSTPLWFRSLAGPAVKSH